MSRFRFHTISLCTGGACCLAFMSISLCANETRPAPSMSVRMVAQKTAKKTTGKTSPKPQSPVTANGKVRTKAEIEALITKEGKTPPDWFDATPLDYPKSLNLDWPKVTGGWNN
ncbi:MAG: FMN-binding domain protein, partial [Planctomycetaceae bacterium]|nr:FMN-binding domain protein [Planctomycetaceae bacterium]